MKARMRKKKAWHGGTGAGKCSVLAVAMGKRRSQQQPVLWVPASELPTPPDHSTVSRTRRLVDLETHQEVFIWILAVLAKEGLPKGKTLGVDATTLEANAALRTIVRGRGRHRHAALDHRPPEWSRSERVGGQEALRRHNRRRGRRRGRVKKEPQHPRSDSLVTDKGYHSNETCRHLRADG